MKYNNNNLDIRVEMLKNKITQTELAERLGITQGRVAQLLNRRDLADEHKERFLNAIRNK